MVSGKLYAILLQLKRMNFKVLVPLMPVMGPLCLGNMPLVVFYNDISNS